MAQLAFELRHLKSIIWYSWFLGLLALPALCLLSHSPWASLLRRRRRLKPDTSKWTQLDRQGLFADSRFLSESRPFPGAGRHSESCWAVFTRSRKVQNLHRVTESCAVPDGWWRGHPQPPSALEPDLEATWKRGSPFWEKGASHGATSFSCPSPPQRSPGECFRPYLCTGNPQRSGPCRGSLVDPLREWSLVTRLQCLPLLPLSLSAPGPVMCLALRVAMAPAAGVGLCAACAELRGVGGRCCSRPFPRGVCLLRQWLCSGAAASGGGGLEQRESWPIAREENERDVSLSS